MFTKVSITLTLFTDFVIFSLITISFSSIESGPRVFYFFGPIMFVSCAALLIFPTLSKLRSRFIRRCCVTLVIVTFLIAGLLVAGRVPWGTLDFHLIYYLFALFIGLFNFACIPLLLSLHRRIERD